MKALFTKYKMDYSLFTDGIYNGAVDVNEMALTSLEFFVEMGVKEITGYLDCRFNHLTSLVGCPSVGGSLYCSSNQLTSLEGCPRVGGNLYCNNNNLTSLAGCGSVGGHLNCYYNNLTSLEGCPRVGGNLDCSYNKLVDIPEDFNHSIDMLICGDAVKLGKNYKRYKALSEF